MNHATLVDLAPQNSTTVRSIIIRAATGALARACIRLAPRWIARTTARRFITPPRRPHRSADTTFLQSGEHHSLPTAEGRLACWRFGHSDAPAVIFSHGWGGRGSQGKEFVPALLRAGFQVWLFDQPGHGSSGGKLATIADFAASIGAIDGFIQSRGGRLAGLIGHSFGATALPLSLCRELRNAHDLRVVLIAPPASLTAYSHFFARQLGLPEILRSAMQYRLEQHIGLRWEEVEPISLAPQLMQAALFIHDEQDRDVPFSNSSIVSKAWPGAELWRTHGLGHRRILQADEVIQRTVGFLLGEPVGAGGPSGPVPAPLY
jgi:pimeloyl-ACP methyl ester carboxylesterase